MNIRYRIKANQKGSIHTLLKQANTLGTPSLGPSMPGMKSILGPIQLKGLTMVNSKPFSAPSAVNITHEIHIYDKGFNYETATSMHNVTYHRPASQSIALHMRRTISASQLIQICKGTYLP